MTTDTCGPGGTSSLSSASLQSSLASRLARRLAERGSTMYSLTWKTLALPSGREICQLRAWARPISASASGSEESTLTGWPTTTVKDCDSSARHGYMITGNQGTTLLDAARLAGWPSPMAGTPKQGGNNEAGNNDYSRRVVELSNWATPQAHDARGGRSEASSEMASSRSLAREAKLSGWATTTTRDAKDGACQQQLEDGSVPVNSLLGRQVHLSGWATPAATELGNTPENYAAMKRNMRSGSRTAFTHQSLQAQLTAPGPPLDGGPTATGSPAATASTGRLNPALSLWLMGLLSDWLMAAPLFKRSRARKS